MLNPAARLVIVPVLFIGYILAFKILHPYFGALIGTSTLGAFVGLPVLAAAYLLGIKAGLLAWLVSVPLQFGLMVWSEIAPLPVMSQEGGFVSLGLLLIAVISVGLVHDLNQKMKRQSAVRQKADSGIT